MEAQELESEILTVCGAKVKRKKEDDQQYRLRILETLEKVPDPAFFKMSEDAQDWVDRAVNAVAAAKDLPDFVGKANGNGEDEDEDDDDDDENEDGEGSDDEDDEDSDDEDEDDPDDEDVDEEDDDDENGEDEDDEDDEDGEETNDDEDGEEEEMPTATKTGTKGSKSSRNKAASGRKDRTTKKSKVKTKKAGKPEADAKKSKGKKAAPAKKQGSGRSSPRADKKIKVIDKKAPVKAGSKRAAMYAAAKSARTVEDYLSAGGTSKFLDVMIEKGWVKLI